MKSVASESSKIKVYNIMWFVILAIGMVSTALFTLSLTEPYFWLSSKAAFMGLGGTLVLALSHSVATTRK